MTTATMTPGKTEHFGDHTVTDMGTLKIGRSNYKIEQVNFDANEVTPAQEWLQLRGPRGTSYQLQEDLWQTGKYTPVSLGSGPMVRKGNRVRVTILGNLIEVAA